MQFRVGQRVRFLHESGEGVISSLLDQHHVEVDLGDDFPIEVHISEVIPVAEEEKHYQKPEQENTSTVSRSSAHNLFELSLIICPEEDATQYQVSLFNPEPVDILFTCYIKWKSKHQGTAHGLLKSQQITLLGTLSLDQITRTKEFYFQLLSFKPGPGYPHQLEIQQIPWNKNSLKNPTRFLSPVAKKGWDFSLRKKISIIEETLKVEGVSFKKMDLPTRKTKEVDLHIEELVSRPHKMAPSEMLKIQLQHAERAISQAIMDHCASLVFIHGVGEGVLRKEIRKMLEFEEQVSRFENADPAKYGNGATIAYLK
ncbi:MAG: Smr/MutS family protein [Bacteroidota bacterium]